MSDISCFSNNDASVLFILSGKKTHINSRHHIIQINPYNSVSLSVVTKRTYVTVGGIFDELSIYHLYCELLFYEFPFSSFSLLKHSI